MDQATPPPSASSVALAWRATHRKAYLFPASSDAKVTLGELLSGEGASIHRATPSVRSEFARLEAEASFALAPDLAAGARVSGGRFSLRSRRFSNETPHRYSGAMCLTGRSRPRISGAPLCPPSVPPYDALDPQPAGATRSRARLRMTR